MPDQVKLGPSPTTPEGSSSSSLAAEAASFALSVTSGLGPLAAVGKKCPSCKAQLRPPQPVRAAVCLHVCTMDATTRPSQGLIRPLRLDRCPYENARHSLPCRQVGADKMMCAILPSLKLDDFTSCFLRLSIPDFNDPPADVVMSLIMR